MMMAKRLLLLIALLPHAGFAADSSISITGSLKSNTCTVSGDSKDLTVNLQESMTKQFRAKGNKGSMMPFSIILDSCGGFATAVKVSFTGVSDINAPGLLKLDPIRGNASGVGIQLLNSSKEVIPLNAASATLNWQTLEPGKKNALLFYAQLMAIKIPVTAGHVSSSANFILEFQ